MRPAFGKDRRRTTPLPPLQQTNMPVFLMPTLTQRDYQPPLPTHKELQRKTLQELQTMRARSRRQMLSEPELLNKTLRALLPRGKRRLQPMLLLGLQLKMRRHVRMQSHRTPARVLLTQLTEDWQQKSMQELSIPQSRELMLLRIKLGFRPPTTPRMPGKRSRGHILTELAKQMH
jgi:hypothetical protein